MVAYFTIIKYLMLSFQILIGTVNVIYSDVAQPDLQVYIPIIK
jgi:fibrillarin-like rRNA methylase